jgi:hypothetical protein
MKANGDINSGKDIYSLLGHMPGGSKADMGNREKSETSDLTVKALVSEESFVY